MSDVVDDIPAVNQAEFSLGEARVCTGSDDKTLIDLIGQASSYPAVEFLKEVHSFSQAALDLALILACQRGFKYLVQKLVHLGADIECRDASGKTPLLICVENHYLELVRFLVARRADVKAVDCAGNNALILSISFEGSTEMLHFLLGKADIMINHQNNDGYTAVMKALEVMDVRLLVLLLETYLCENSNQQSSNTSESDSKWTLLDQTVNCKGETAQQIAEKHGLGSVLQHLKECISERTSPILAAIEACDLETLDFLLVSQLEPENEINKAFSSMFLKYCDNEQNPLPKEILPITKRLLECGADVKSLRTSSFEPSPVSIAVDAGDYDLVELLCKHGAPLNQQMNESDKDPLCLAAKNGRIDLIELLLKYNADVNTHGCHNSPLNCALIHGHIDCARFLVNHGAKMDISLAMSSIIEKQNPEYMKILFQNYEYEIINYLLEDVKNGNNLLIEAVKGGNLEIIEQILQAGVDVNIPQQSGATPIVESKNGAVALLLIRYGADVNHVTDITNETPLMHVLNNSCYTADSYKEEVVRVLLENGASVHARTSNGTTPLMLAASLEGHEVILQTLLHHGADCSDQDNYGNTALLRAILRRCSKNAKFLIQIMKNNTNLNLQNNEGHTALMCDVAYDSDTVVSELIDSGADVNITDADGNTALHLAVASAQESQLKVLVNGGCDINHQNKAGLSPLMLAAHRCNCHSVSTLINLGADVNAVSCKDASKTALSCVPRYYYRRREIISCIDALLDKGANASFLCPRILSTIITKHCHNILPKLIQCGLGPINIDINDLPLRIRSCEMPPSVSPFCLALLIGDVPLARYFWRILFMTVSDLYLPSNKIVRRFLQTDKYENCLAFLDEVSSRPMSLFKMCFVTVTSAVGSSPGREARVSTLPLPWIVKDMLLFKSDVDSFATPESGDHKSNGPFEMYDQFQTISDTDSEEESSD
ncbi:hypothetical protein BsWGS_26651 [Bradybaena similaris]